MATQEWKTKRLNNTNRLIEKAKAKLTKLYDDAAETEAEVVRLTSLAEWLDSMPVEDAEPTDDA